MSSDSFDTWRRSLNNEEEALLKKILGYEEKSMAKNASIGDLRDKAREHFTELRWMANNVNPVPGISEEDYINLALKYGPDLLAIPRLRSKNYVSSKHSKSSKDKEPKEASPKQIAFRKFCKEFHSQNKKSIVDFSERAKAAAKKWKEMTEEEKKKYE